MKKILGAFYFYFYQKQNINTCLVRHPLIEEVDKQYEKHTEDAHTIGIAPGSRKSEVKKLFPVMLKAAQMLYNDDASLKFLVPMASGFTKEMYNLSDTLELPIKFEHSDFYSTIRQCDVVMIASGTATLQTGLMGKAMVIVYKISPITYRLFGHLVKVEHIGLANIMLDRRVFTELLQNKVTAKNLCAEIKKLLSDNERKIKMVQIRTELYNKLNAGCSSKELAEKALSLAANY